MIDFELFHFLRPLCLAALPAIGLVWWLVRRQTAQRQQFGTMLAPHLREALTVNRDAQGGFRAVDGVCLALAFTTLAAAGPSWDKQPSPWFTETAPLLIAIELSDSMRSNDLQPTRLDRARLKILDLIERRTGARTALIAYAGSAHIVVPPSTDPGVLKSFLESLDPAIMPAPGADAATVVPLATQLLGDQQSTATVLFVNDGFDSGAVQALAEYSAGQGSASLAALVLGTEQGGVALMPDGSPAMAASGGRVDTRVDPQQLKRVSREAGVDIVRGGVGHDDIDKLLRTIQSNLERADDPDARWRDRGWWLLWPAALLMLLWFRRGWTMQW